MRPTPSQANTKNSSSSHNSVSVVYGAPTTNSFMAESPKLLVTARTPFTLPLITNPPASVIRFASCLSDPLWSYVRRTAFPARQRTPRASPALALYKTRLASGGGTITVMPSAVVLWDATGDVERGVIDANALLNEEPLPARLRRAFRMRLARGGFASFTFLLVFWGSLEAVPTLSALLSFELSATGSSVSML